MHLSLIHISVAAVIGEAFAARRAGEDAANQTVISPSTEPQIIPTGLMPSTGKELNLSLIHI